MDLNAVEQYLKNNNTFFASIKVLSRKLNIDKKRIKWLIAFSTHLKAVEPIRIGSGKSYLIQSICESFIQNNKYTKYINVYYIWLIKKYHYL